jgi:LPS O-antigen subunit length determinant protein (WzzB/FepE family)
MATARNTIGTVFETVSTAATVLTGSLNVVSVGVGMANAFVNKAAKDQAQQHLLDAEVSTERMILEASREDAEMKSAVRTYCAKSVQHAEDFTTAYDRFTAVLRPKKVDSVHSFGIAA